MSQINIKSISGITSITTPAGVDNQFTLHTNDTTERLKITSDGLNVTGVSTLQDLDVDGHTNLDNVSIAGVTTMTGNLSMGETLTVSGNNPNLTFTDTNSNPDFKIYGSNGTFSILDSTNSVNRFVINSIGNISISNDLDVDGHTNLDNVSISGVVTATSFVGALPITGDTNNRVITATGSGGLNGEANLTFNSSVLGLHQPSVDTNFVLDAVGSGIFTKDGTLTSNDFNKGQFTVRNTTASQGAFLDFRAASSNGARGVIAKIGGFNTKTGSGYDGELTFSTRQNSDNTMVERLRITSDGKLTMSSGTVELESNMIRIGNRTTSQINAGVSTSTGSVTLDTTDNNLKYYADAQWNTVKKIGNDGSTQNLAARSAKALLDEGYTSNGVYWLDMHGAYSSGNAKRHYCLMDSSYDGGGWTLLYSMNHGNNFASGSNYSFALNVGSNPTNTNDFIASNFGYDRRNTFTPQAGDQFLIRRSDNNDWRRFVVTTWSPTANSVSNGWTTTNDTTGTNRGHPYYALGQMYDTSGNAVSGMVHFNGCAIGGNCNSGGGDGDGFGDHVNWSSGYSPYSCWGGAFNGQSNGGSPLYWGQNNQLSQGGSLYVQMFYRKAGTQ